jgi:hypothetical protein
MSSSTFIPGITSLIEDGNLGVARPPSTGDSVLIIGTAEDGPLLQPIPITSTSQLTGIFGRFGQGNLVRGVYETMYATDSHIDVRAMRIGNGAKASVGIKEASGYISVGLASAGGDINGVKASGLADPSFTALVPSEVGERDNFIDALTLTARYSGTRYNNFTVRLGRDDNPGSANYGKNCVIIYNPFTGTEKTFSYDYYYVSNTSVDVHDVVELADAINADSDLNPYIAASTTPLTAQFEIVASGTSSANSYVVPFGVGGNQNVGQTYAASEAKLKEGSAISTVWNSDGTPRKVTLQLHHITTAADSLLVDGIPDPVLAPTPEYGESTTLSIGPIGITWSGNIHTAGNQAIELSKVYEIALASGELLSTQGRDFAATQNYPINRNTNVYPGSLWSTVVSLNGAVKTSGQYRQRVVGGIVGISETGTETVFKFRAFLQPDAPSAVQDTRAWIDDDRKFRVYETVSGVTAETRKAVTISWSTTTKECTLTFGTTPAIGTVITVDYVSLAGSLTEVASRTTLETYRASHTDTNPSYQYYFVTGNNIYFGYPHETDVELSYEYKREYSIGGDVVLSSPEIGKIEFVNIGKVPQIHRVGGARIGVQYTYKPEWVTITGSVALAGGGNGTSMTALEVKDALDDAYDAIANYTDADIIVPMGVHLDDTYDEYSPETGIKRVVNAGFHTQLASALDTVASNTNEVIGILPVKLNTTTANEWVTKLTITNSTDRNRAANYMSVFDSKRVQVVAADIVVSTARLGVNTLDYITDGAATYAGLVASLPAQMPATNKYIGRSLLAIRYKLSRSQQEALLGSRYVIFDDRPGLGMVAVKDVTAAAPGSDYDSLSTFRIAKMVVDMVRGIGQGYIGTINSEQNRASLKAAINNALYNLTSGPNQALRKYNLRVVSTLEDQRAGVIWVDIVLFPIFGIKAIRVTVKLSNAS